MSCYKFAYKKKNAPITAYTISSPSSITASVADVVEIELKDQFTMESGAEQSILCALPYHMVQRLFKYNENELLRLPEDIRGLRSYRINGIQEGKSEGGKFHRIGTELVFVLKGAIKMTCKDIEGSASTYILNQEKGILIPPYILHSYLVIEDSDLLVISNTISNPDDPKSNDTYTKYSNGYFVN